MDADSDKPLTAYGFLTVLENAEHGLFGGYLVLSPQGRPLEFRCSAPIQASRAQEILYGPTLRPYLLSEVIGQALVSGAEVAVPIILTDDRDVLPLALLRSEPVALVESPPHAENPQPANSALAAVIELGGCRITAPETSGCSAERLHWMLESLAAHVLLSEPFERIRAALVEAQLATHEAAESNDDRAAAA